MSVRSFRNSGRDLVTFPVVLGTTLNGSVTSNPVIWGFDRWQGPVELKVYVRCCGVSTERQSQCEESFSFTIIHTPAPFSVRLSPQPVSLTGRGRLALYLMLQCDRDFYGAACDTLCRVNFPAIEHAFCNVTTGEKQCELGWEGRECQIDANECRFDYCQNGARCDNSPPGSFTCHCPVGFNGRLCQHRAPQCHSEPCKNGGSCHDTPHGVVCLCPVGFFGHFCERQQYVTDENDVISMMDHHAGFVENSTGSDRLIKKSKIWENWYIIIIVAAFIFIVLIVVICCLARGRLSRYSMSPKGSTYNLFVTTKTYDNVILQHGQHNSAMVSETSLDDSPVSTVSPLRRHSLPDSQTPSQTVATTESKAINMYGKFLSKQPISQAQNQKQPISQTRNQKQPISQARHQSPNVSLAALDLQSQYEILPNLVDPKKSPLLVHRDLACRTHVTAECSSTTYMSPLPVPSSHPKNTPNPKHKTEQHAQASTESAKPPTKSGQFQKAFQRANRDVYSFGGSLSSEDLACAKVPLPKATPKKLLLANKLGKRKMSEPTLRFVQRMDSGGYEVPVTTHHTTSISTVHSHYAVVHLDQIEHCMYTDVRHLREDAQGVSIESPMADRYLRQVFPPEFNKPPSLQLDQHKARETSDINADRDSSDVDVYLEIHHTNTLSLPENLRPESQPDVYTKEKQPKPNIRTNTPTVNHEDNQTSSDLASACSRSRDHLGSNSAPVLMESGDRENEPPPDEVHPGKNQLCSGKQEEVLSGNHVQGNENVTKSGGCPVDTDEEVTSDFDYSDVVTKNTAAV